MSEADVILTGSLRGGSMRWLHLSDIHVGHKNERQKAALTSLVEAIEQFVKVEQDVILITGDLAFSGKDEEYSRLEEVLLGPLLRLDVLRSAKVVSTPGNHDLDCDTSLPITWDTVGASRKPVFFD